MFPATNLVGHSKHGVANTHPPPSLGLAGICFLSCTQVGCPFWNPLDSKLNCTINKKTVASTMSLPCICMRGP